MYTSLYTESSLTGRAGECLGLQKNFWNEGANIGERLGILNSKPRFIPAYNNTRVNHSSIKLQWIIQKTLRCAYWNFKSHFQISCMYRATWSSLSLEPDGTWVLKMNVRWWATSSAWFDAGHNSVDKANFALPHPDPSANCFLSECFSLNNVMWRLETCF